MQMRACLGLTVALLSACAPRPSQELACAAAVERYAQRTEESGLRNGLHLEAVYWLDKAGEQTPALVDLVNNEDWEAPSRCELSSPDRMQLRLDAHVLFRSGVVLTDADEAFWARRQLDAVDQDIRENP